LCEVPLLLLYASSNPFTLCCALWPCGLTGALDNQAGHKAVCSVKREEREHPFYHSHAKAATLQLVHGKDPIAALIADHEDGIKEVGDTVAALQSGNAAIIEIPERIGKRGTPTYSVVKKGGMYNW
jgi:hypothetical protein